MTLVKIQQRELDSLREKAEAHDVYLEALRDMRVRQATTMLIRDEQRPYYDTAPAWARDGVYQYIWCRGWLDCFDEINRTIASTPAPQPVTEVATDSLPF